MASSHRISDTTAFQMGQKIELNTLYDINDIRQESFKTILLIVYIATWLGTILSITFAATIPRDLLWLDILLMGMCGVVWWLNGLTPHWAPYNLIAVLWVFTALASSLIHYIPLLYGLAIVIILSSNLTALPMQLGVALLSSIFISQAYGIDEATLGPLGLLWVSLIASTLSQRGLIRALDISNRYQNYAIEQMKKAREQRAELAKMTQALLTSQESLRNLNSQLRYARDSAEEARKLKAQFAANVSHELRTPINLIVGFSEMIAMAPEAYRAELPSAYRPDIQAIYRNATHLQNLINDILDISQIEAAKLAIVKEETNPKQVIEEAALIARSLIESKKLDFCIVVPDDLPIIRMDRTRIRQVVLNLLANAVRFTHVGTITLEATYDERVLTISVIDTGQGIPEHELGRVFEEFYQVDANFSRKNGGTGLGLALSKQFIIQHGGRMWIESEGIPGKGAKCSFTLPLTDSVFYPLHDIQQSPKAIEVVRNMLVWDDDPAILQLFKGYSQEHRVKGCADVGSVIASVVELRPIAVVAGAHVDTEELEATIQHASPETALIKCPMPSGRRAIQAIGLSDYLVKPVSRQAILDALEHLGDIEKVLIVDDDWDVLRMLTRFLQTAKRKYIVNTASNGLGGLDTMRQDCPDAVVLDILMPDVDGFTVIEHMKADPFLKNIPVIIVSARGSTEAITQSVEGRIMIQRETGFQPIELVSCIEALVSNLMPSTALIG
jgi:signal transduction histidine kinase/CheY-like chemotaxis protein